MLSSLPLLFVFVVLRRCRYRLLCCRCSCCCCFLGACLWLMSVNVVLSSSWFFLPLGLCVAVVVVQGVGVAVGVVVAAGVIVSACVVVGAVVAVVGGISCRWLLSLLLPRAVAVGVVAVVVVVCCCCCGWL